MPDSLVTLGWREWVVLPGLGIPRLRAKVDSGARSSALHVDALWRFTEAGAPWVGFRLSHGKARGLVVEAQAPIHDERDVIEGSCDARQEVREGILFIPDDQSETDRLTTELRPALTSVARAPSHGLLRPLNLVWA